jgi:hypothetical protein
MYIELHDSEVGNTLSGRWNNIDYDYQAEMCVQSMWHNNDIVKYVLFDEEGERAVWEKVGNTLVPTSRANRFTGQWNIGTAYTETDYQRQYGDDLARMAEWAKRSAE